MSIGESTSKGDLDLFWVNARLDMVGMLDEYFGIGESTKNLILHDVLGTGIPLINSANVA
ncbi:MAG: hypothetical protein RIC89_09840 [Pseudomonadales bacterium]